MSSSFTVGPVRTEELQAALRLQFQSLPELDRRRRVAAALEVVRSSELDPAGIVVARSASGLSGVMVCQVTPGASGLVWPPRVVECANQSQIEDELVRRVCSFLRSAGAKLAHALLTEIETTWADPLARNGFQHITRMKYLRHELQNVPLFSGRLRYQPYDPREPALFQQTLLKTYEETLDCPELNAARTIDEVIAGHQAQGRHDAAGWWLALDGSGPVGVLLLADVPALGGWDLSYLGVTPTARRRGIGHELASKALWEAHRAGAPHLGVAVDTRNEPARRLYRRLGFMPFDERELFLALWR
jgi:mycothiol synthase